MHPYGNIGDDRMELDNGEYSQFGDHPLRRSIGPQNENRSTPHQPWNRDIPWESWSRENDRCRPSTAPANLYNNDLKYARPFSFRDSYTSSSRKPSVSWSSDINGDDRSWISQTPDRAGASDLSLLRKFSRGCTLNPSEWNCDRSDLKDTDPQRRRCLERIPEHRPRPGQGKYRSVFGHSRSRSPYRSHVQRTQGPAREDWPLSGRRDLASPGYPRKSWRLSACPPSAAEDLIRSLDHRRSLPHSPFGSSPRNFGRERSSPLFAPDGACPAVNIRRGDGGDPFFTPCRGDVIIVPLDQRGRIEDRCRPRQHYGCVRCFSGSEADFVFRNGDLVVRIGSFASTPFVASSYLPYRILELYRRHDGMWTFLGDAHTEEDLFERRRNSCVASSELSVGTQVGLRENSNIEPNYGDIIIHKDRIRCPNDEEDGQRWSHSIIEWWTPQLPERLHMVYPDNTILLRPYVLNTKFLQTRESWLGRRVTRVNWASCPGNVEEGIVVKVWPEFILHDDGLEVLGPDRVGVRVRNPSQYGVEGEIAAWPLSDTFLECSDRPLSADPQTTCPRSIQKRSTFMNDPWGSIELYIYSKEPPAGWVYWGSSQHMYDRPFRPSSGRRI